MRKNILSLSPPARLPDAQELADRWYMAHGPCCAGCDWWHLHNSLVGECRRSAPVPAEQRVAMLGIHGNSFPLAAGHVMTPRDHHCGDFKDDFDWKTLPTHYLQRIGYEGAAHVQT